MSITLTVNQLPGVWIQVSHNRYMWFPSKEVYEDRLKQKESISPNVIDDTMQAAWHPITGEVLESKSRFREVTRAHGCVEVGNELLSQKPERPYEGLPKEEVREAILRSLDIHGCRRE